ncbi:MAG TPA: 3'-5' exonuclease [Acidobacteriota bacterium]|nr:3'-5' exonuclease [Acidobacteriota bacterium]
MAPTTSASGQQPANRSRTPHSTSSPKPEPEWKALQAEEINALPLKRFPGPIHVISHKDEASQVLQQVREAEILGFDTETRPAFKKGSYFPPALLQLATEAAVYLFQISQIGLIKGLRDIMADPKVLKVGVGLDYDVRELRKLARFKPASFLDVGEQAKRAGMDRVSLRTLAATFLGFRISKGAKCSNWAVSNLKKSQIKYAATDAWVSREIYLFMAGRNLIDYSMRGNSGRTAKGRKAEKRARAVSRKQPRRPK